MRLFTKMFALLLLFAALASCLHLWYETYLVGRYYASSGVFLAILGAVTPVFLVVLGVFAAIKVVKYKGDLGLSSTKTLAILIMSLLSASGLTGCDKANANVQTLFTSNCGVSWTLIKPGETIPQGIGMCSYKVSIPDFPMQGEISFKTSFKNRVLAKVEVAYEYSIVDAIKFIGEARYLGKKDSDADDAVNSAQRYESAENAIIDKRIRDVAAEMLLGEDIVEFSQGEFEDKLLEKVNKRLEDKGIHLNFLSFVPTPEEQTRLAIDLMTAFKIYESKGLTDLGKSVAAARAGATQIHMNACGNDKQKDKDKE